MEQDQGSMERRKKAPLDIDRKIAEDLQMTRGGPPSLDTGHHRPGPEAEEDPMEEEGEDPGDGNPGDDEPGEVP